VRLLEDFRQGHAAALMVDVQLDLFDRGRLRVRGASEQACALFPFVGQRIDRFARAASTLRKTWMVHTWNRQLRAIRNNTAALLTELAVKPADDDTVIPKDSFCSFSATPLAHHTNATGTRTLVITGAVFEDCVTMGYTKAIRDYGLNVVLVPDLIAGRGGESGRAIANRFNIKAENKADTPWLGVLFADDVLGLLKEAQRSNLPKSTTTQPRPTQH